MGKYNQFIDGYAEETTFGTSIITAAGDTTYKWGAVSQESVHPSPVYNINYTSTGVNTKEVGAGLLWKSQGDRRGMYGLRMQNGILCWAAMGASSTAGADPYTHTITPTTDGTKLPSFTIQHERKGDATNEEYQFQGCKIDSLMLFYDDRPGSNFLLAKVEWMAANESDPGFALTNAPALPATANTASYSQITRTWDANGTPVTLDGLQTIEVHIINGLMPVFAHSYDGGAYTGDKVVEFVEAPRKQYLINMTLHQSTIERALWTELIGTGNTKDAVFKWTRSTNDYIQVTATDCQVKQHEIKTPLVGKTLIEQVVLEPRAMSIEVKDSIVGGRYGE
jgi:hypothetical protein